MLLSLPCFYAFCWSAIPTSLKFFILVHVTFLAADACLSWSLPSITGLSSQASYAVLAEESLTRPGSLQTLLHTNCISNSAILHNNYILLLSDLCACIHVKKKWCCKGSHSSSVSGSNRLMRLQTWKKAMGWCTAQWKMLVLCKNHCERVTQIWTTVDSGCLAHLVN